MSSWKNMYHKLTTADWYRRNADSEIHGIERENTDRIVKEAV